MNEIEEAQLRLECFRLVVNAYTTSSGITYNGASNLYAAFAEDAETVLNFVLAASISKALEVFKNGKD